MNTTSWPDWADIYIECFRQTGRPAHARAEASIIAGVSVTEKKVQALEANNIEFYDAVEDERQKWAEKMEEEAYRRGVTGIDKGVYYKGQKVDVQKEYSDTLLMALLKANYATKYADKKQLFGPNGGPLTVVVRKFSDEEQEDSHLSDAISAVDTLMDGMEEEDGTYGLA